MRPWLLLVTLAVGGCAQATRHEVLFPHPPRSVDLCVDEAGRRWWVVVGPEAIAFTSRADAAPVPPTRQDCAALLRGLTRRRLDTETER